MVYLVPKEEERHIKHVISNMALEMAVNATNVKLRARQRMQYMFDTYSEGIPWTRYYELEYYDEQQEEYVFHWKENPFRFQYWQELQENGKISGLRVLRDY